MTLSEIKLKTRELILKTLNIEDVQPEDIVDDISLLSGENIITIDSIDVLEIVVAIQQNFKVKIRDQHHARLVINNVDTIAEFIYSQRQMQELS